ncbi:TrmH family RNA methyltransferase [Streptomyces sp. DSM 44917]|uniref:TrmH family RNA methyltransferase n=1 Tax=Streptomyces boetiae TaxID=3075541 RepID=A0ABU2L6F4_9ACTN|nr:TrmH family RNA methyltransferase [Streptomyces sp. DSM 44917]MDT0307095.1 TrmH family RNA methyltransferase [Streptomyces sp. DSM 44917]
MAGEGGAVLLDGFHALKHALRFGAAVHLAVAAPPASRGPADGPGAALALARDLAPDLLGPLARLLTPVSAATLRELVPRPHPTGVAALAAPAPRAPEPDSPAPVVLLEDPRHLGNLGAVVRVAAGAGAAGILTTGTTDPWHPAVLRAAAGLHWATPVSRLPGLDALPPGRPLYALDPEGTDLRAASLAPGALLAFGSERSGLSAALRARADVLLALPMRPGVSSYNLATSVAMALYHWLATPQDARR